MSNILFIVEGRKLEPELIKRLAKVYDIKCNIVSICTNIHTLYEKLKEGEGYLDLLPVLKNVLDKTIDSLSGISHSQKELDALKEDRKKLNNSFAEYYLVFDSELHDDPKTAAARTIDEIVAKNLADLQGMLDFFNNETDPGKGKLYINYPMMESYRDCDDFFDNSYCDRFVDIEDLFKNRGGAGYKAKVNKRKLSNLRTNDISKENFNQLICMNIFKLNFLYSKQWNKPSYNDFHSLAEQSKILEVQKIFFENKHVVAVLNTLLFFPVEYLGEQLYEESINPPCQ